VLPLALAAALASASVAQLPAASPYADDEWDAPELDDEDREPRVRVTAWGGTALGDGGSGISSSFLGGEAGWAFDHLDLGVAAFGYRNLDESDRTTTPVVLARLTQRFRTGRGIEAAFGFGIGAGRPTSWKAWYQLAIGVRVPLGPLFLAGELAFEQYDLLRLGAGLGVALF
jgi:hypothetical protein